MRLNQQSECPFCYQRDDQAEARNSNVVLPGHFGVCPHCGGISKFDEHMDLKPATDDDLEQLAKQHSELLAMMRRDSAKFKSAAAQQKPETKTQR